MAMSSAGNENVKEFDEIVHDMEPDSVPQEVIGAPIKAYPPTPAAVANWTKISYNDAISKGMHDHAKKFLSLHQKVIKQTTLEDINTEIARFYFRSYELQSAEINMKAVAMLSEEKAVLEDTMPFIESNIDRFGSLVEDAITSAYRRITSSLNSFKEKVSDLKKETKELLSKLQQKFGKAKESLSELKQKFVKAFNDVLDYFARIFSELVTIMFSFVDLINKIAELKGYKFKDVNISFDPPSVESITILGFSLPFPKVSLPKIDIGFDMQTKEDKSAQTEINSNNNNKESNEVENGYYYPDKAIALNLNEFNELFNRGKTFGDSGNHTGAIEYYDKAIAIYPNSIDVLNYKGVALYRIGKYDEAIRCFDKAIELNPFNATLWKNKGNALYHSRKYQESIIHYDKALQLNPNYDKARIGRDRAIAALNGYSDDTYGDDW